MSNTSGPISEFRARYNTLKDISTSSEIAEFLKGEGIRGEKSSAYTCPISNYINAGISSDSSRVITGFMNVHLQDVILSANEEITDAMSEFVDSFDSGQYPDLEWGE